jgi:hypothetical protein
MVMPDGSSTAAAMLPATGQEEWRASWASSAVLGPCWVRAATVAPGHQRSPAVAYGSEEPQVAGPLGRAAGMMRPRDSDCGPDGQEATQPSRRRPPAPMNGNTPAVVQDDGGRASKVAPDR